MTNLQVGISFRAPSRTSLNVQKLSDLSLQGQHIEHRVNYGGVSKREDTAKRNRRENKYENKVPLDFRNDCNFSYYLSNGSSETAAVRSARAIAAYFESPSIDADTSQMGKARERTPDFFRSRT